MDEQTTRKLEETLKKLTSDQECEDFLKNQKGRKYSGFNDYINAYMAENEVEKSEIARRSNLDKSYAYQVMNEMRNAGRDKILAVCIAAGMNYAETNRGLESAGLRALYPKDERDAWIAICINRGMNSVMEVNEVLSEKGFGIIE